MSDDFRFDDDDFSFDDDDDFSFDNDLGGSDADDLAYDDFSDDVDLDDDYDFGGDEGDELDFIADEDGGGRSGPSRTFLLVAGLLIIILLAGVVLLVVAITGQPDPSLVMTRTAIAEANATTEELIRQTQTQSAVFAGLTQTATLFTATPSPSPSPTPTETPDDEATQAVLNATQTAEADLLLTEAAGTAFALTAVGGTEVPPETTTEPTTDGISPVQAAQLTATALAEFFNQTPTVAVTSSTTTTTTTTTTGTDTMPDTGLFDEVGSENVGIFFLMAFGLIGVIVGSRRLRTLNKRKRH